MKRLALALALTTALVAPVLSGTTGFWTTNQGNVNFPMDPTHIDGMDIGDTTPAPGHFTTLSSTSAPSGAGNTANFAAPPPIGSTTPNTGAFTTLSATSINNTPVGNTTPSTGAFTTGTFSDQISSSAGLPTIASGACGTGTNGVVVAGSTNQSGSITIGATATTTCTVAFSKTLGVQPNACILMPANAAAAATGTTVARVSSITTAQFVITGSALANANYYYICL